jgi:glycosyltransferase involved in cell wall biosynthesis
VYTLLADEKIAKKYFSDVEIEESFLKKAPVFLKKRHKYLFPLMPTAVETFNLRDYDVVISSSSAFAKGIVVKPKTSHICYMHAPMRYVWDFNAEYLEQQKLKGKAKFATRLLMNYLRIWDRTSAERVDVFVANSNYTAQRIKKYYRKQAQVIYPPVDVGKFKPQANNEGYFLTVGRLSPYKRSRLMIDVFTKLKLPLVVVGVGQEYQELKKITADKPNIKLIGWIEDEKLVRLYQNARAFVCASEDDFNITAVEAMAAGKPVIALRKGGTSETVLEGITGEFFDVPQMEIMADGIRRFIEREQSYDHMTIREHAKQYDKNEFKNKMYKVVEQALKNK